MWKIVIGVILIAYCLFIIAMMPYQFPAALIIGGVGALLIHSYFSKKKKDRLAVEEFERREEQKRKDQERAQRAAAEAETRRQEEKERIIDSYSGSGGSSAAVESFVEFYWRVTYFDMKYEMTKELDRVLYVKNFAYSGSRYSQPDVRSILADDSAREKYFDQRYGSYYAVDERRKKIDRAKSFFINTGWRLQQRFGSNYSTRELDLETEDFLDKYFYFKWGCNDQPAASELSDLTIRYQDWRYNGDKYKNDISIFDIMIDNDANDYFMKLYRR